jgi:hypothetical protein
MELSKRHATSIKTSHATTPASARYPRQPALSLSACNRGAPATRKAFAKRPSKPKTSAAQAHSEARETTNEERIFMAFKQDTGAMSSHRADAARQQGVTG